MSDHPLGHKPKKFASILNKKVYDECWLVNFYDKNNRLIFKLDPYVLHGPNSSDKGFDEIKKMAADTAKKNPFARIHHWGITYLGSL